MRMVRAGLIMCKIEHISWVLKVHKNQELALTEDNFHSKSVAGHGFSRTPACETQLHKFRSSLNLDNVCREK